MTRPTAPRPYQTEKTKAWTDDEMNAILDAIATETEKGSVHEAFGLSHQRSALDQARPRR